MCIDVRGIFCDKGPAGESDRQSFFADSSGHHLILQTSSERKGVQAFGHCQTPWLIIACVTDRSEALEVVF